MKDEIYQTVDITECMLSPNYIKIGELPDGREVGYFPGNSITDEFIVVEISLT
jgi:hypothetical protein